jgi:branched-chain amino acid transport system ATP-binding protein
MEYFHVCSGASHILSGVSLEVAQGTVVYLLGRHCAGKRALMQTRMELVPPRQGCMIFRGEDMIGLSPRAQLASPENRRNSATRQCGSKGNEDAITS